MGYLELSENLESPFSCLIAFLCQNFLDITPRPPVCIYDDSKTTMSSFICDMKQGYIVQHFLGRKTKREKNDPFWKTVDCGFIWIKKLNYVWNPFKEFVASDKNLLLCFRDSISSIQMIVTHIFAFQSKQYMHFLSSTIQPPKCELESIWTSGEQLLETAYTSQNGKAVIWR
jgi:hypothetical protein